MSTSIRTGALAARNHAGGSARNAAASRGTTSSAVRPEGNFSATTSIHSGRDSGARFW
jgi:hypothetical protein